MGSDPHPQKRPERFWCHCVHVNSSVQLLCIKRILRATLRTIAICLASEKSHSDICPLIFLAWFGEIHSKHIISAMISLGKNRTYLFIVPQFFAPSCKWHMLPVFCGWAPGLTEPMFCSLSGAGKNSLPFPQAPLLSLAPFTHMD